MIDDDLLKAWFSREILPLEPALTRFIRRNWRNKSDVADLRQEIYARIYGAARMQLPLQAGAFLFTTARNHLINCAKSAHVVSMAHVVDLEASTAVTHTMDLLTPDRHASVRDEFRRLQEGLDQLPPRCREVVVLRKVHGFSTREVAKKLNVGIDTVEQQIVHGMRALIDFMAGGSGKIQRSHPLKRRPEKKNNE